jgi:hypothetical protein
MILDIKSLKVYIISPGENKYRQRVLTVFDRLLDEGFRNITFFKSLVGPNNTASLTNTVLEIFKQELKNDKPFMIVEDDCAFFTKYDNKLYFNIKNQSIKSEGFRFIRFNYINIIVIFKFNWFNVN